MFYWYFCILFYSLQTIDKNKVLFLLYLCLTNFFWKNYTTFSVDIHSFFLLEQVHIPIYERFVYSTQNCYIIPFRNANKYIVECINSIIIQQYSPYEVYLLDDASDDMLDEQIKKLVETTSNFHYSRNNNRIGLCFQMYDKILINKKEQ